MKLDLTLRNSLSELKTLNEQLERAAELRQLPKKIALQINLVLDELFTNAVSYGYTDDSTHLISLTVEYEDDKILMTMIDDGLAFDPSEQRSANMNVPPEEREEGGLGIFLVHHYVDDISYCRKAGRNVTVMEKKLTKS